MPLFPRIGRLSGSRAADCGRALLGGAALRIVRFAAFIFGLAAVAAPVVRVLGESAGRAGRHRLAATPPLASALTQTEGTGSRLSLARIASAGLVHAKGLGSWLCSAR